MIKQKYKKDCGVASLAMFYKVTYEEAYAAAKEVLDCSFNEEGITDSSLIRISHVLGGNLVPVNPDGCFDAIYTVASLNNVGGLHFIYKRIHRSKDEPFAILDPSNSKTYTTVNNNQIVGILADYGDELVSIRADLTMDIYKQAKDIANENTTKV